MTGRPRSSGRSRCSTAAKNASRSTWRIVRSGTLAIIDPLWKPLPAGSRAPRSPPSASGVGGGRRRRSSLPAGVVLVWPVLFVVPGWVVVRRVAPDLPVPGAVGVAVVAERLPVGALVDIVARVVGFDRPAILVAGVLIAVGSCLAGFAIHGWPRSADPHWPGSSEHPGTDTAGLAGRRRVGLVVACRALRERLARDAGRLGSGGWNWSDLLVHVAIGVEHRRTATSRPRSPTSPASP